MPKKHHMSFRSLFASTESLGAPPVVIDEVVPTEDGVKTEPVALEPEVTTPTEGGLVASGDELTVEEAELASDEANEEIAEINEAESAIDEAETEAEATVTEAESQVELNEEFIEEAKAAAEADDFEKVTDTVTASNDAFEVMTGNTDLSVKAVSGESYTNPRVRQMMMNVSVESLVDRTVELVKKAYEKIKQLVDMAIKFVKDFFSRFQSQEKRLKKLLTEIKSIDDQKRLVVNNKSLAARLSVDGKMQGYEGLVQVYDDLTAASVVMKDRATRCHKLFTSIRNPKNPEEIAANFYNIMKDPITGESDNGKITFLGGFEMQYKFAGVGSGMSKMIEYEFTHKPVNAGSSDIALPTPNVLFATLNKILSKHSAFVTAIEATRREMKLGETALGAAISTLIKAPDNVKRGKASKNVFTIAGLYNRAFLRPMVDLLKVSAFSIQTANMLATAMVRAHAGKEADEPNASTESFSGTVSDSIVDKLREDTPESDNDIPSDSGTTKDEPIVPARDSGLNETPAPKGGAVPAMTQSEFEDTNAGQFEEELAGVQVALEDLELREGALDDTAEAIEIIEAAEGDGGLNQTGAALLNLSAESVNRLMGWKDTPTIVASVESYNSVTGRRMANAASLENFKDRFNAVVEQLKKALKIVLDWIKHVAGRFYEMVTSGTKRNAAILEALKKATKDIDGDITNAGTLRMLSSRQGALDVDGVIRAINRTVDIGNSISPLAEPILDAVTSGQHTVDENITKTLRGQLTNIGAAFVDKEKTQAEVFGLLGGQQLNVKIVDGVGLAGASLTADDSVKPAKAFKIPTRKDAIRICEAGAKMLADITKNSTDVKSTIANLEKLAKATPKPDAKEDLEAIKKYAKAVQTNARAMTQYVAASMKSAKYAMDTVNRLAKAAIAGDKPEAEEKPAEAK